MNSAKFPLRLFSALFLAATVLIIGGAWYVGNERISAELDILRVKEIGNVVMGVRRLDDELAVPLQHLRTLSASSTVRAAIDGGGVDDLLRLERTVRDLMAYSGRLYDKIRWIDTSGKEKLRVNNVGGQLEPVPPTRLQDLSGQSFFLDTMRLQPGQYYISRLDLNVEGGKIETPYKPVLRLATALADSRGQAQGILILNIAASRLLDAFVESMTDTRDHAMLLDSEGYWLVSPDASDTWGFALKRENHLGNRHPEAWQAISGIPSGQVEIEDDGGLWTWSTIYPLKVDDDRLIEQIPHWLVVTQLPAIQLSQLRQGAWRTVSISALILLVLFGMLAAWLSATLASRTRARVETARAQAAAEASTRLAEAQQRFRLVVEANANGLLVVDEKGRIEMANAALEHMFGYEHGELLGRPMEILLPDSERARHAGLRAGYLHAPAARPMGAGRDLHGLRKDGSVVPVEISLSSFMQDGRRYVDAIVADISQRKQLEERLQSSEAHLNLLLSTHPDGLLVADGQGRIQMTNPRLDLMFGYAPGELNGQAIDMLVPEAMPVLRDTLAVSPGTVRPAARHLLQGRRKDGHAIPVDMRLTGFTENGQAFIHAAVTDRSERMAA